jgi:hypothetical protein
VLRSSRSVSGRERAHGDGAARDGATRGFARHFDGWQPGLLAVFLAGSSAILAVPQSIQPTEIPEPIVEPRALERVAREDEALAAAAAREHLDVDVREVGRAMRAYGLADAEGDDRTVVEERRKITQATGRARAQGDVPLLRLRAYQLASFQRELRRWEGSGEETSELHELGGAFVDTAKKNGWIDEHRLILSPAVRAALFKKRWASLAGLGGDAFELNLDENRALYAFLLEHPPHESLAPTRGDPEGKGAAFRVVMAAEQYRLQTLEDLHRADPGYPVDLGRGVVLYRLRRYALAVEAFRRHLDDHPEGPFALCAHNYLRAALERTGE